MRESDDRPIEARRAVRTNLFLAAVMHSAGVPHPVRIRDLSAGGARVESKPLPEIGTAVTLVRGGLRLEAAVSWSEGQFCGLRFEAPISVSEWMTHPILLERQRSEGGGSLPRRGTGDAELGEGIAQDLRRVSRLLAKLGVALAVDPAMVRRHRVHLESLGIASETLIVLAEKVQSVELEGAASRARRAKVASQCSPI